MATVHYVVAKYLRENTKCVVRCKFEKMMNRVWVHEKWSGFGVFFNPSLMSNLAPATASKYAPPVQNFDNGYPAAYNNQYYSAAPASYQRNYPDYGSMMPPQRLDYDDCKRLTLFCFCKF